MADNVTADAGSGGATFASDDIGGVQYPRTKLVHGADGTNDGDVSTANPLPVDLREIGGASVATGGGVESGALRVTLANDSTGVVSVDDGGGALTVDNGGTFGVQEDGAALTALQLIDDPVFTDDAAFTPATSKLFAFGAMADETTPDSVDEGDIGIPRMSLNRNLYVQLRDAAGNERGLNIDANGDIGVTTALDGAIAGSELQVDVVAALPAGTNAIGKLAANDGVDIGDVDVASLPSDTFVAEDGALGKGVLIQGDDGTDRTNVLVDTAGHLQIDVLTAPSTAVTNAGTFAVQEDGPALTALQTIDNIVHLEDAAHNTGDAGVMVFGVRQDAQADFGADGDYVPLSVDANGAVRVTGGGGGTEYTEDAVAPANPVGGAIALVREDGPATIGADGDIVAQRATAYGAAYCQILDSSGSFVDTFGGGTQHAVDDALGATPTGTLAIAIRDDALTTLTPVEGDAVGLRVNSTGALWIHSADLTTLAGAVSGTEMQVDVVAALPAGTNAIGKLAANSGVDIGDVDVTSVIPGTGATDLGKATDSAAGATDTGVATLAVRDDELSVQAADGDYVQLRTDRFGRLRTTAMHDATSEVKRAAINATTNGDNTIVAAAGAGIKIRVVAVALMADAAVGAAFEDGAAGAELTGQFPLAANGGFVLPFNEEGWFETSDNTLLNLETDAAANIRGVVNYVEV